MAKRIEGPEDIENLFDDIEKKEAEEKPETADTGEATSSPSPQGAGKEHVGAWCWVKGKVGNKDLYINVTAHDGVQADVIAQTVANLLDGVGILVASELAEVPPGGMLPKQGHVVNPSASDESGSNFIGGETQFFWMEEQNRWPEAEDGKRYPGLLWQPVSAASLDKSTVGGKTTHFVMLTTPRTPSYGVRAYFNRGENDPYSPADEIMKFLEKNGIDLRKVTEPVDVSALGLEVQIAFRIKKDAVEKIASEKNLFSPDDVKAKDWPHDSDAYAPFKVVSIRTAAVSKKEKEEETFPF